MDYGVALAYVGEELVAEAFAAAGSLDEACYVDDVTYGGDYAAGVYYLCEGCESLVGDADLT